MKQSGESYVIYLSHNRPRDHQQRLHSRFGIKVKHFLRLPELNGSKKKKNDEGFWTNIDNRLGKTID